MSDVSLRFLVSLLSSVVCAAFGTFESNTRKESFSTSTSIGEIQCGLLCVQNGRCDAINYNKHHLICELVETSAVTVSETDGWKHTSNLDFVAVYKQAELCRSVSIQSSFVCVPLQSQAIALVRSECTTPVSTPSNAIASADKINVGVSVTFTCEENYAGSGEGTSTCLANGQWSSTNYQCSAGGWPEGTYTLLQPSNGCPAGFDTGQRIWYPERTGQSTFSTNSNLQGYANQTQIDWHFCTKPGDNSNSEAWPSGDYCIMRQGGACPTGFSSGSITIDEEDYAPSDRSQGTGTLPDGNYDRNSVVYFCCKNDGSVAIAVTFPSVTPFILFPYSVASCQMITGMTEVSGYTFFDTETSGNIDANDGAVPYVVGPPTWYIHHCYYQ